MSATQPKLLTLYTALILSSSIAIADEPQIAYQPIQDSPIGIRNQNAPSDLSQFDFVIGDWDVLITWSPPSGDPMSYKAKWHNRWINNGHDVSQEWRGPYITGTEFRHYNKEAGHWVGRNLYVGANWIDTTARKDGENMVVIIEAHNPKEGKFLNRETYHNITKDRWEMKSDLSFDNGETWVKGRYKMIATKHVD